METNHLRNKPGPTIGLSIAILFGAVAYAATTVKGSRQEPEGGGHPSA